MNMSECFNNPMAPRIDAENRSKYGTDDYETIELIEKYSKKVLDEKSDKLAEEKTSELFKRQQEKNRLEVIKEINEANLQKEFRNTMMLSPYFEDATIIDSSSLNYRCFLDDRIRNYSNNDDFKIILNSYSNEWYLENTKGKRKYISDFQVTVCIIVNPTGIGRCEYIVVFITGHEIPLIFPNGDISPALIKEQTRFCKKGFDVSDKVFNESFYQAIRCCTHYLFLKIPKHYGFHVLSDGTYDYTSSLSVIPGLEKLYPEEITQHKIQKHDRKIEEIIKELKIKCKSCHDLYKKMPIRIASLFLKFFADEGLKPDRIFVFTVVSNKDKDALVSILKRYNFASTVTTSLSDRITKVKNELTKGNDTTSIFTVLGKITTRSFENALEEIRMDLTGENGNEEPNRKIICIITNVPELIPEEFPAIYIPVSPLEEEVDTEAVQKLLSELDYSLIKYAINNLDAMKKLIHESIAKAKELFKSGETNLKTQSQITLMIIATAVLLNKLGICPISILQYLCNFFKGSSNTGYSLVKSISDKVGRVLSQAIRSKKIPIANQFSPPFWSDNKAFIASDNSINISSDVFEKKIISQLPVGKNKALQYLKEADFIAANNPKEQQRTLLVQCEGGETIKKRFISLSYDLLDKEAKQVVNLTTASDMFHSMKNPVDNLIPYVRHPEFNIIAGAVVTDHKIGNPFTAVTGTPGSGKTDFLIMQAFQRALAGKNIVVLDPTNSFKNDELLGHKIPLDLINKHCVFWDMSTMGFPVNILDFDGCEDITQRVQRLSSLLISGMHLTGPNQKAIVITKAEEWLKKYEKNNTLSIFSLLQRFDDNADDERKLKTKLNALLSTVKKTDNTVQPPGWDKLLSEQGKVLVISAGSATINVEANPFDILLDTLYSFKDKHKEIAMTVILDEVQTLNHHKNSTLVNILSRGRKLNLSVILASQDYSDEKKGLGMVYAYCGTKVFFRPLGDECVNVVAKITHIDHDIIATLPNFTCAVSGAVYSKHYGKNIIPEKAIIGVTYRPPYVGSYDENI